MRAFFLLPGKRAYSLQAVCMGLLLLGLVSGGCGYKSLPVAPQGLVPMPVADLKYQLSEKGVTLTWSYPQQTLTGEEIDEIDTFLLYRAVIPTESYCDTCPIPWGNPIKLPGGVLPGMGGKIASYESTLLRPDNLYFFKVHSSTGWMAKSGPSNQVTFMWQTPPEAPSELTATAGDKQVRLAWQPVTSHLDGTPVTGPVEYQVSRSQGRDTFKDVKQVSGTDFTDTGLKNGIAYTYRVQTLSLFDGHVVNGGTSEPVEVSPVDQTAPAVPVNVGAVRTAAGIKIYWDRVKSRDLRGYRVFRRGPGDDTKPEFLDTIYAPYSLFEDTNVSGNARDYYYSVSSFDKLKPANESARSAEVRVR